MIYWIYLEESLGFQAQLKTQVVVLDCVSQLITERYKRSMVSDTWTRFTQLALAFAHIIFVCHPFIPQAIRETMAYI